MMYNYFKAPRNFRLDTIGQDKTRQGRMRVLKFSPLILVLKHNLPASQ